MRQLLAGIGILIMWISMISGCSNFGTRPNEEDQERLRLSRHYNKERNAFENHRPDLMAEMRKKSMNWEAIKEWFAGEKNRVPTKKIPEIRPDIRKFLKSSDVLKMIWLGHSSFMINMEGKIILIDPVFSNSASPIPFLVKRFQKPVLELDELPEIDFILISHDHYDHLDMRTTKFFLGKKTKFISPLGVGSHLRGWGIDQDRIVEKDWWESETFSDLEFICVPAQHFSGRVGMSSNDTLWASWIIKSKNHKIYYSGDSGYDIHFREIGEKYGPFEAALLDCGQYNERWREVHMFPEEAVTASQELKSKKMVSAHWGMFELALHSWVEPAEKLSLIHI